MSALRRRGSQFREYTLVKYTYCTYTVPSSRVGYGYGTPKRRREKGGREPAARGKKQESEGKSLIRGAFVEKTACVSVGKESEKGLAPPSAPR